MAEVILMPRLSDTMTEGVIAAWHKNPGDAVKKGDLLADIETDKATMELESYQEGTLLHTGGKNGDKLQVNDLLAIIGKQGEDISQLLAQHSGGAKAADNGQQAAQQKEAPAQKAGEQAAPQADKKDGDKSEGKQAGSASLEGREEVVLMPRLSDTMTEGVIAAWHKNVGDAVNKGDILADIETDKATMELESYKSGTLLYAGAKAGEKIQVNDLLAIIGDKGKVNVDEIVGAAKGGGQPAQSGTKKADQPSANAGQETQQQPADEKQTTQQTDQNGRVIASPLAKKLAGEKGIDLKQVQGSGDNGRIVRRDVDQFQPGSAQAKAPQQGQAGQPGSAKAPQAPAMQPSFEEVPVSQMRKVIAKRLAESKFTAPHFYLTMSIDMDAAVAARTRINEGAKSKISFNDIVLKGVAVSLQQHPKVNSSWLGDKIRINHHVNIGVAVAVEEGLLVPVVRYANTKSLSQIAAEVKDFAQRAKDKKLQPADWEGSTFTISNLGMFGIDQFTAIINPPDACILAVGAINQVPVVKDGQVKPGNVMKLTLSCDHRVVDGATGAAFLQTLKSLLEEPLRMLV